LLSWLNIQVVENHLFENLMRGDRFRANSKIRCSFTERVPSGVHENISGRLIELAVVEKYSHQRVVLPLFFPSLERGTSKSRHCNVVTDRTER